MKTITKKLKLLIAVSLLINSVSAQFSDITNIDSLCSATTEVCTGDINNDGLQDIILSKAYWENKLTFYLNEGGGNFGDEQIIDDGQYSGAYYKVASVDLNADNYSDVITFLRGYGNEDKLAWFPNSEGSFGEPVILDDSLFAYVGIICKDIDNDNDIDVIADDDISIRVYKNDGAGNFTPPDIIASSSEYYDFDVADFNGDGFDDIIAVSNEVTILWNDTEGNFPQYSTFNAGSGLLFLVAHGDFDNNNDIDFVLWSRSSDILAWYSNDGTGIFSLAQEITTINLNFTLEISDVDLDGDLDILSATNQTSSVIWFENDGTGNYSGENIIYQFEEFHTIESIYTTDLDNDGDEEVIWGAVQRPLAFHDNTTNTVSIKENIEPDRIDIQLYPNPAKTFVNINSEDIIENISVYNHLGQLIKHEKVDDKTFRLNTAEWVRGIYFIQVHTSNHFVLKKIIKK